MVSSQSPLKDIPCVDEMDETLGRYNWNQKAEEIEQ